MPTVKKRAKPSATSMPWKLLTGPSQRSRDTTTAPATPSTLVAARTPGRAPCGVASRSRQAKHAAVTSRTG
jgi:hypothetical protein